MHESEWLTRKSRIDKKLKSIDPQWKIVPYSVGMDISVLARHAIEEFPTESGPADYALVVGGRLVGFIEAKRVSVSPQNVLEQAKRYARATDHGIGNWNGFRVPFIYATNGEIIWYADVRTGIYNARRISKFHTADGLQEKLVTDHHKAERWLADNSPSQIARLRYYQRDAISSIETEIRKGRREMLVAMATGTGKTFFTVAQIYRLLESKRARRILFLVDRKALAAQAVREFSSFNTLHGRKFDQEYEIYSQRFRKEDFGDDEPFNPKTLPNEYLTNPNDSHTFVYVSTIQRMAMNLFGPERSFEQKPDDPDYEEDAEKLDIPIHAFDVIIADECHRGYSKQETSVWRDTLNHFDAIKIGLTATPAPHTTSVFGDPVFRYGVAQAITDGFLVDWDAIKIKSDVKINGVFLEEGESIGRIDTTTGEEILDELEDERQYESTQIESEITVVDSNRKIIKELADHCYKHEEATGRFPKTLIFAVNDMQHTSHADQIVSICREVFGQGDDFVQKITGNANVDRPLQKIREFRNRPNPKIVVTVDMLTTGVDIPSLEFLVFMRPVKSRILWEQMLGRGTRLCAEINKTNFTVVDCFDGTLIEYFKNASAFKIEPPTKTPTPLKEVIENIYQNVDRQYHTNLLVKRLQRIEKNMTGNAREQFAAFIPDGDIGKFAADLPGKLKTNFTPTLKLLRNENFQDLLLNYERAKKVFLVSYEEHDEVSSQKIERYGKFEKPEEYLEAFSKFVAANASSISALKIVLKNPKQWRTDALAELRQLLGQNDFREKDLQRAHDRVYHKALADIISMVKHAADQQQTILTAEERVNRAVERVTSQHTFDDDQMKWLNLICEHLIENLTIDENDFDDLPVFYDRGGSARARRVFGTQLTPLVEQINAAIAA
jgi:type I restriction enzyme R subunit